MIKKLMFLGMVVVFGLVSGAIAENVMWDGGLMELPAGTANGTLYDFNSGFTMVSQLDPAVYGELLLTPTWLISFQGKLENMEDQQLNLTFRIFDAKTGGSKLWEDTYSVQTDGSGIFNVLLGSGTEKLTSVDFRKPVWLEVRVGTATLSPRQSLTSAPSALVARSVYGAYSSVPAIVYADNQAPAQGVGVMGMGASAGGSFQSTSGYGVFAKTDATDRGAVYGEGAYAGLAGNTASESGSYGVRGSAPGTSTGVYGVSYKGIGIEGYVTGTGGTGVKGVYGNESGYGIGVHASAPPPSGYGKPQALHVSGAIGMDAIEKTLPTDSAGIDPTTQAQMVRADAPVGVIHVKGGTLSGGGCQVFTVISEFCTSERSLIFLTARRTGTNLNLNPVHVNIVRQGAGYFTVRFGHDTAYLSNPIDVNFVVIEPLFPVVFAPPPPPLF